MKKVKRIIAIIMCCMVVLIEGITSHASVALPALPALPYIPPSRAKIWDILNNIWGMTGLPVSDEEKRAQAYEEMMLRYLTQAQIDEIVQGVRERRKYEIKAGVRDGLAQYMQYQVSTGYEEVETPTPKGVQETYNKLLTWQYINESKLPIAQFQTMYNTAVSALGTNILVLCTYISKGVDNTLVLGFVKNDGNYTFHTGNQSVGSFRGLSSVWKKNNTSNAYQCIVYGQNLGGLWSRGNNNNSVWFGFENTCVATSVQYGSSGFTTNTFTTKGESYTRKPSVQSSAITEALAQGTDYPITKDTTLVNGAYDTTQTTTIDYPATDVIPATNVNDLVGVQEKLGVVPSPITQDLTDTVAQLQAQSVAQYGDTGQYALDLRNYFPFCIPFDIANLLGSFVADPQAPSFEWKFPIGIDKNTGEFLYETQTIDLSAWDIVAYWVRKGELALFIVGLAVVTRQWFLRG